jgi:hypothetical protein
MADPSGNGGSPSAASVVAACGAQVNLAPILANARPGTVWGPDPNFVATGVTVAAAQFQRMTQFLAADPSRVGLYLRSQFSGVRITTMNNGQGVPITLTMGNAPGAGGTFELWLWAPQLYVVSPWFWGVADAGAPPTGLDQLLTWIEFFKA